jgi:hypothetical protein
VKALIIAAFTALGCVQALAQTSCNPPPPGLSFAQWSGACQAEIAQAYQLLGNGQDFTVFVGGLYQLYVQATINPQPAPGGAPQATGPCSLAGQTFCNGSGWLLTCNGQQWLTGTQRC